ncbi:MAG TPA: site-specific DNA-methyltransferase [Chitinophagaceae bacterium]|nr:site-specific DNA-methyltransferase [Chitinophagaceae bacterium]
MMYPRLFLAKNLLQNDGVIFVHIDDNEVHNLRLLMNEIFGEENFLGQFIINSTPNARDYGHIGKMHEYTLFYARNNALAQTNLIEDKEKHFKYIDETGGYNIHPLYNSNVAFTPLNRKNLYYPFYLNLDNKIETNFYEIGLSPFNNSVEIFPPKSVKDNVQFVWRWGKEKSLSEMNKNIIGYKTEEGEYRIVQKMRTSEKLIRSLLLEKDYSTRRGTAEAEEILGKKIFDFPKPVGLIKLFLKAGLSDGDYVLDFFSGSGTTAQAVLELNEEDGGSRKFIMVQFPEPIGMDSEAYKEGYHTIAEICRDRIRNVLKKIKTKQLASPELFTNNHPAPGFKSFKLSASSFKSWTNSWITEETLVQQLDAFTNPVKEPFDSKAMLCELMLKAGYTLTEKVTSVNNYYSIDGGRIIIALSAMDAGTVTNIIAARPEKLITLDLLFTGKDELKTNTALQMKAAKIDFKTI